MPLKLALHFTGKSILDAFFDLVYIRTNAAVSPFFSLKNTAVRIVAEKIGRCFLGSNTEYCLYYCPDSL